MSDLNQDDASLDPFDLSNVEISGSLFRSINRCSRTEYSSVRSSSAFGCNSPGPSTAVCLRRSNNWSNYLAD